MLYERHLQAEYLSRVEGRSGFNSGRPRLLGDEWIPVVWLANITVHPLEDVRLTAFTSRDVLETFAALERRITYDTLGFAVDTRTDRGLFMDAAAYRVAFSDENRRSVVNAKFSAPVSDLMGLRAEVTACYFENSRTDTIGYFNPQRYHQGQLLLVLNRSLNPMLRLYAIAGPGIESVSPGIRSTSFLGAVSLHAFLTHVFSVKADYGYSDAAVASPSAFRRQYVGISLFFTW
jgi:hypothetical protein